MRYSEVLPQKKGAAIPCEAADILELNQTKEYTASATVLLEHVLTDTRLQGQAAKLWQIMFSKARFDKELKLTVSNAFLASTMSRSPRQIQRYLQNLIDCGYLIIQANFHKEQGQLTNSYYIRFPLDVIEMARQQKDRREGCVKETSDMCFELREWDTYVNQSNFIQYPPDKIVDEGNDKNDAHNNKSNLSLKKTKNTTTDKQPTMKNDDGSVVVNTFFEATPESSVRSEEDELNIKIEATQQLIKMVECQITAAKVEEKKLPFDPEKQYKFVQEVFGPLDTKAAKLKDKLDLYEKQLDKIRQNTEKVLILQNNDNFMLTASGNRSISEVDFAYLKNKLSQLLQFQKKIEQLPKLLNEICYAIRFGNLQLGRDKQPLGIRYAINVALKLVRETRWEAPKGLESFLKNKVH